MNAKLNINISAAQNTDEKKWYLLQMRPNQHYRGLQNLLNQDYECYSPDITLEKIKNCSKLTITEPLFPGYVFIKLSENCNWPSIASTRGVGKFVRFSAYPAVVPEYVIQNIDDNINNYKYKVKAKTELRPGTPVKIVDERFKDFEGIFKCSISKNRSIILIRYLHKVQEVQIKTEYIRRVV